jgi:ubiquinone/menaquinone biosynthesis C-methylase UbiE
MRANDRVGQDISRKVEPNIDWATVEGFGEEWDTYDQTDLDPSEERAQFEAYFSIFPFETLPENPHGFDLGCGSGRWAEPVAEKVGTLHCIDPSEKALAVARRRLSARSNVRFHQAGADSIPLPDASQDFGYSLGVLHHIPDPRAALHDCVRKLKPGAPFLVYLYYRFDNRPLWFRGIWRATDIGRRLISRLPFAARKAAATVIAATVYWPLARVARWVERRGQTTAPLPLNYYRNSSFYTMRTDALDRFGTRLEHRFTRSEIAEMMQQAGLEGVQFREDEPYWVACGRKAAA